LRPFELTERDLQPGCRDVQISGELDLAVAEHLNEALQRAIAEAEVVLVGLEACEFIDSSGIAVVLRAQGQLVEQGGRLGVYGPRSQVLRVLSMTGLTANGLVFDSAEQAIAALA
jgi:anti-anti-sigma factor